MFTLAPRPDWTCTVVCCPWPVGGGVRSNQPTFLHVSFNQFTVCDNYSDCFAHFAIQQEARLDGVSKDLPREASFLVS